MNRTNLKFLVVMTFSVLLGFGCAKKHKPDVNDLAANALGIQEKDMTYDSLGSDSGKIEGLYTIHFDYDKSSLTEESRGLLFKDADWIKQHPGKSVQVEGHTDRNGSTEYNLALGQRRAEAVKNYLLNLGIKQDRLSTISYGKEQLLDSGDTEQADAKNRRANFKPVDSPKIKRMSNL